MVGGNALRLELHPMDALRLVLQTHDDAVIGLGRDLETFGQALALYDQRMVARRRELVRHMAEDAFRLVVDIRHFPMHQPGRTDHLAAKGLTDRLMPKADAEDRYLVLCLGDQIEADAGLVRPA